MATTDGPLQLARRRLADAVAAVVDPIPVRTDDGHYRWRPGAYAELRSGLTGQPIRRRTQQRSRPPLRIEVLALLVEIDDTAARWEPDGGKDTVERLRATMVRAWRPQDCRIIDDYCAQLQRWVIAATELIAPAPKVFLPMSCPRCGSRFAYHRSSAGEQVRTRALQVSETGCQCLACGACWEPDQFHWLARLLGCPTLPGLTV